MSHAGTILLVEDNPITRKMVRFALESKGFVVVEAPDGATALEVLGSRSVDLVLQDLMLPDIDGFDLVARLRRLEGAKDVPILAFSGFLSKLEEARLSATGFTDVIVKPIEPSQLLRVVRAYLPAAETGTPWGMGRAIVVADDDPVQRKLECFKLERLGFEVTTAANGREALDAALARPPVAIVSDVMMPVLDGFGLCAAVRRDPGLSSVPVVLVTSSYLDEADRDLALRAGANAFVLRTPEMSELVDALHSALAAPPPARLEPAVQPAEFERERAQRVLQQLERQVALNAGVSQRCAVLSAQLSVLSGISEALARDLHIESALNDALAACFDAGGISVGALYLLQSDDSLRTHTFGHSVEGQRDELESFFGEIGLLRSIIRSGTTTVIPTAGFATEETRRLLARAGLTSALVVPLIHKHETLGALLMVSQTVDLNHEDRIAFAQAVANQISLALVLARAFLELQQEIEARKHGEEALRQNNDRTRFALRAARMFTWEMDVATQTLTASGTIDAVFGAPAAALRGSVADFLRPIHPDDREAVQRTLSRLPDGGSEFTCEYRVIWPNGETRWAQSVGRLQRDEKGGAIRVLGVTMDVTARKRLEAQFLQAQKMEAIGQLAGGVAHDFNNMLTAIVGYTELLLVDMAEDDPKRRDVDQIRLATESAAGLTRQLLAFGRRQVLQPAVVCLDDVVLKIDKLLARVIGADVQVRTALRPDTPPILADAGQLEQVLVNLAVNARDAMSRGGTITVATDLVDLREGEARDDVHQVPPGRYVTLAVGDTGCGMTEAVRARIFEPFFTTKEIGKGTGMGLATVFGIVQQSGGHILVDTEVNRGTTFRIYFPQADGVAQSSPKVRRTLARGTGRILLVEDTAAVRALTRDALRASGYDVVDASTPDDAWNAAQAGAFDLLVTDIVMPGMNGHDLATRLKSRLPHLKVLFISGYAGSVRQQVVEAGESLLGKPFTPQELTHRVRELLESDDRRVDAAQAQQDQ